MTMRPPAVSKITDQERASQELPKESRSGGGLAMVRVLFRNPSALKKFMVMNPGEERWVRPPRAYELPKYREGMKYCRSNEKYLRPTRWCNPREPLVIAMAHELGAYELSDWEFAEAAYWFVKTKMMPEMVPMDGVSATLRRGTGTCYHLTSVFVALCRAAGIKARYKSFTMVLPKQLNPGRISTDQAMATQELFSRPSPEAEGEACIDGKWTVAHVAMRPELIAKGWLPIPKLGEDGAGLTFSLAGPVRHFEAVPLGPGVLMKYGFPVMKAAMERINVTIQQKLPQGGKIIEEAGGLEAYDRKAREIFEQNGLTVEVEPHAAIVFGDG
jgi:Transglutaminase-like superfamily